MNQLKVKKKIFLYFIYAKNVKNKMDDYLELKNSIQKD